MGGVFLLLSKISFYGTTLILAILILALCFKFYDKTENKNDNEVNSEYIASYFDGEYQNQIPGKHDGYYVEKIVCDNGASATWNNAEWGINIRNATQKIKCSIYFKKMYSDGVIAEPPSLLQGLIPVVYNDSGDVIVADVEKEWYNYKEHKWANAVLVNCSDSTIKLKYFNDDMSLKETAIGTTMSMDDILQMYVYVPRYKYKLFNAENGTSDEQAIEIAFESIKSVKSSGTKNGEWLTHPAFTFGDTELPGIWVGKFEASGSTENYTIKPNLKALDNLNIATMYNTAKVITTDKYNNYGTNQNESDSHLIKNMEWGAVTYLTNSIYGRYSDSSTCITSSCEVWINNINSGYGGGTAVSGQPQWGPSITGCAGASTNIGYAISQNYCVSGYDWKTKGVNASTTGNQYGVYDMSGGTWEYVMGFQKDSSGEVQYGYSGFDSSNMPDSKYYDLYDYQENDSANYSRYHLGDATKEILKDTTTHGSDNWWNDAVYTIYRSIPWIARGGYSTYGKVAGIFSSNRYNGGASTVISFRTVITES